MDIRSMVPAVALLTASLAAAAAQRPQIAVEELTLANGMRFLLYEQHASPVVAAGWVAHVGSANERPGITGLSHFFEHMMFKGTHAIGTKDLTADLRLIEQQESLREEMRREEALARERLRRGEIDDLLAPANWSARYRELQARFQELVQQQRLTIVKDEMDQIYTRNGGEALNAFTNEDLTAYFVRVPQNRLELWAWLESDRLRNPVFREFYSERDVVFEERRLRTESTPLGKFDEAFSAVFWDAHPYTWPVVGWASDIPSYTKAQADAYFATYYAPNNLTGVLAGDFRAADVKPLLERYFGRIPRGREPVPEVVTLEPRQLAEKRYVAEADTSPTVRVWWQGVAFVHRDRTVLDLLTDVLSGRTGRLYKGLVLGRKIANEAEASLQVGKYGGAIQVECVVKDGQDPAAVEQAVYEELAALADNPLPADELTKVKNQAKANAYRRLSSPFFVLIQLMQYAGRGDWRYINTYADEVEAVTAADIQRVARDYFTKERRTVGVFTRKAGAAPEDPDLQALAEPLRAHARQALAQLANESDPGRVKQVVAQLEQAASQAPAQTQPLIALLRRRAGERLAALESGRK
jgi:predicted Zn-dependent peptidase